MGGFPCFLHSIYCSIPKKGQDFLDFIFKFLFPRISLQGFFYANLDAHATKLIILNKSVLYNHYFCIYIHIQYTYTSRDKKEKTDSKGFWIKIFTYLKTWSDPTNCHCTKENTNLHRENISSTGQYIMSNLSY